MDDRFWEVFILFIMLQKRQIYSPLDSRKKHIFYTFEILFSVFSSFRKQFLPLYSKTCVSCYPYLVWVLLRFLHIVCYKHGFFYIYFDQIQVKMPLVISNLITFAINPLKSSLKLIIRYLFTEFLLVVYFLFIF